MDKTRRNVLKKMAGCTVAVTAGAMFIGCTSVTRKDLNKYNRPLSMVPKLSKDGATILYYASLAPSGHNIQPWYINIIDENNWVLCADPKRRLPVVDKDNRGLLISIGTFLENLSIASSILGYKAQIEIVAKSANDENIATISLKQSRPGKYPLERLLKRRTVRKGLLQTDIKRSDIKALTEPFNGNCVYFPRESKHGMCIAEAQVEAYRVQTYRKAAIEELKMSFRLSNKDAKKHRDGLTLPGMEISGITGWYLQHFMSPEDMANKTSQKISIDMNNKLVKEGAGWFVITSNGNSVADVIETGRKFEQMALISRERMVSLAPMTQALEEESGQKGIASHHGSTMFPQLIIRTGYLKKYPDPVSLRRPVSWFVRT